MQRMSYESFVELYEKPRIPVVITGLQEGWTAQQLWNQADLSRRFGNHKFKVCFVKSTGQPSIILGFSLH